MFLMHHVNHLKVVGVKKIFLGLRMTGSREWIEFQTVKVKYMFKGQMGGGQMSGKW